MIWYDLIWYDNIYIYIISMLLLHLSPTESTCTFMQHTSFNVYPTKAFHAQGSNRVAVAWLPIMAAEPLVASKALSAWGGQGDPREERETGDPWQLMEAKWDKPVPKGHRLWAQVECNKLNRWRRIGQKSSPGSRSSSSGGRRYRPSCSTFPTASSGWWEFVFEASWLVQVVAKAQHPKGLRPGDSSVERMVLGCQPVLAHPRPQESEIKYI